jgi:dTDP-4-amino-4,6-dideoxygalactose transaminase
MRIPIAKPMFDDNEMRAILEPLKSGWVSQGPIVQEFENIFKSYVGTQYASAVSSGTAALHLALLACGVQPGDEVITSPFTCVATVNPIEYIGARPVFVDIDLKTFNIDASRVEEAINHRTKAIIAVHLFGLCADMDSLKEIAFKHNLVLIEDAALALGSFYKGQHAGSFGTAAIFSFHPRKMITTGEGGMVVTNNEEIDHKIKELRNYGASISAWHRHHGKLYTLPEYHHLGFNYKMTDIQASLGIAQMQKLESILKTRRRIAERYAEELSSIEWLVVPAEPPGYVHAYQSYVCLFNPDSALHNPESLESAHQLRNKLMDFLYEKGITTVQGAQAIHTVSYYKRKYGFSELDFPNALMADKLSIALPIYPQLSDQEQTYIIENLKSFRISGG